MLHYTCIYYTHMIAVQGDNNIVFDWDDKNWIRLSKTLKYIKRR